ncbi:uncharacterized protein LOC126721528 [Quercus robur]|uniref:uncharacterized protein LOC126721528 n=1 Tax=Quercus robur TaxID=38942 RepID=UPI0021628E9B|nr:uncharacterized protein LOC126721528 [Quercus robur]
MGGNPSKRNQILYCHYHQERGHITEDYKTLLDHLDQLVKAGKLKQFLHQPMGQLGQLGAGYQRDGTPQPTLGTINVIFATPRCDVGSYSRVMSMASNPNLGDKVQVFKRAKVVAVPTLGFLKEDKEGTFQPHDDALVVTLRIGGYDVKRVLVDQGSGAEIMYPDLYKGFNLRLEDLEKYDLPLVGFDGRTVIPRGMIRLLVQVGDEEVQVNFIVVESYSPYTAILARPWLQAMGAVSSTLHLKVKYPTQGRVRELVGN